jgi:ADP-ribose pyrophosphatase YjhB (NUDIX family)
VSFHGGLPVNFCPLCAARLTRAALRDEARERDVCPACGYVHYVNPRVVANMLPERDGRILLLRRAIEPSYGKWTFPGGYLELGESVEEGARREALEEVGLEVEPMALLGVYTLRGIVVVVYRGRLVSPAAPPVPGPEVLETGWFLPAEVPWPDLAFESTEAALRDWLKALEHQDPRGRPGR